MAHYDDSGMPYLVRLLLSVTYLYPGDDGQDQTFLEHHDQDYPFHTHHKLMTNASVPFTSAAVPRYRNLQLPTRFPEIHG